MLKFQFDYLYKKYEEYRKWPATGSAAKGKDPMQDEIEKHFSEVENIESGYTFSSIDKGKGMSLLNYLSFLTGMEK